MFKNMMINLGLTVAGFFAKGHPVALIAVSILNRVVDSKRDSVSNESYKQVMLTMAKSKGNNITELKLAEALRVLGLEETD
jgi:hypothetical protein